MAVIRLVLCSLAFVVAACAGVPARLTPEADDPVETSEPEPASTAIDAQRDAAPLPLSRAVSDAPPPESVPDYVSGWHCFQYRWERDSDWYQSDCWRSIDSCEQSRQLREQVGRYVTECVPRSHAFCFRRQDPLERFDGLYCAEMIINCVQRRRDALNGPRRLIIGECERYD